DDLEELPELLGRASREVVGREQVDGDESHPQLVAPSEELAHLRRAGAVPVRGGLERALAGPAAVAVDDHADVMRQRGAVKLPTQAPGVQVVQDAAALGNRP